VGAANWELVEAHRHALTAFLRGRCPSQDDVEDCVQEAMLRVAQLPDVDPRRLRALLKTVAYNVAMDMHRERRRQATAFARIGTHHPLAPDALALDSWEAQRLAEHARKLSFRERAALRGRADGFAPHETAALLGDSPRSIHLALSRARTSLQRLAGAAGALILWLRRSGRGSVRIAAPSIVAVTLGLAMLAPGLDGPRNSSPPATGPAPLVAGVGWLPTPAADPRDPVIARPPTHHAAPAPAPAVAAPSPQRLTIAAAHVGSDQSVGAYAAVIEKNPNTPLLTGIQNCLAPSAWSLDPHHLGCSG
jgi:RNA polymerase sigma factor (sigma-70 family)